MHLPIAPELRSLAPSLYLGTYCFENAQSAYWPLVVLEYTPMGYCVPAHGTSNVQAVDKYKGRNLDLL